MNRDLWALLASYLYVGSIVVIGESASRMNFPREVSRKIIHVGVGLWVFGTLMLFHSPWLAVIPPLTAAAANYVIHRKSLLRSVEAAPDNLGTVWFPISFALLMLMAWDSPLAVAGGVMAMTFGDAAASLVGVRWGRHHYRTLGGAQKSLEGSLAMLAATLLALLGTFWLVPQLLPGSGAAAGLGAAGGRALGALGAGFGTLGGVTVGALGARLGVPGGVGVGRFGPAGLIGLAALTAVVATCAEAFGIKGRDNLWVPLSAGAVLYVGLMLPPERAVALGLGALLALLIGVAAWLKGSLSPSGVLGAILTGTLLFGLGGWTGAVALMAFFVSSSLLSRLFRSRKANVEAEYAKTGTRDLGQALANGGVSALMILLYGITRNPGFLAAMVGGLAVANADTWATELGVLSPTPPRLITTLRRVEAGASGAISPTGTLAALAGSGFVVLMTALTDGRLWAWSGWLVLSGLAGALLDSLLGATVQSQYWCNACGKVTERQVHRCGARTVQHRGWPWLGNDLVNFLATLAGAAIGYWAAM